MTLVIKKLYLKQFLKLALNQNLKPIKLQYI